jgi:8-amino-3,8-dideoxy-alpha-D-manno-octulosonate transaminase
MSSTGAPVRTKPWAFGPAISVDLLGDEEREGVLRVLEKRALFRFEAADSEAEQLEALYRERLGSGHCLAVNGGTSALVCALIGAGIGPGDEVIVPAYTYIATAAAVLIARAVPVIVEVDDTLTMDPRALEAAITPHTRAVIPVHMRGVPSQMDELMAIARKHDLIVIEDNAQANGGSYKGRALGSIGDAGCLSFQQYKLVTAGEGGLVATDSRELYQRAAIYHDSALAYWGDDDTTRHISFPGENYRMSEINAAIALAQSRRIGDLVARLQQIKSTIVDGIADLDGLRLQRIPDPAGDVSYSLVFYLPTVAEAGRVSALVRDEGIPNATMGNRGIPDRHIYKNWDYVLGKRGASERDNPWTCASYTGSVEYSPDMCPATLDWLGRAIAIGLHPAMGDDDAADVVEAIRKVLR